MITWRTRQKQEEPGTQGVPGETGEQREPRESTKPGNREELENQKK